MGIVYKLLCNETGECYIGSANTKKYYNDRKSKHKNITSCSSKQIIERGNYEFIIIEENIFIDSELRQREQYHIDISDNVINPIKAYRTKEELKAYISNYQKQPHQKEKRRIYQIQHRIDIEDKFKQRIYCECGGKYTLSNKSIHNRSQRHINYMSELL